MVSTLRWVAARGPFPSRTRTRARLWASSPPLAPPVRCHSHFSEPLFIFISFSPCLPHSLPVFLILSPSSSFSLIFSSSLITPFFFHKQSLLLNSSYSSTRWAHREIKRKSIGQIGQLGKKLDNFVQLDKIGLIRLSPLCSKPSATFLLASSLFICDTILALLT